MQPRTACWWSLKSFVPTTPAMAGELLTAMLDGNPSPVHPHKHSCCLNQRLTVLLAPPQHAFAGPPQLQWHAQYLRWLTVLAQGSHKTL